MIQNDIPDIFLALIVSTLGLIALGLSFFRLKSKDLSLLFFGTFSLMYGIRWLTQIQTIQIHSGNWALAILYLRSFITYVIPIPFFAFLIQVFGKGKYNSMLWILRGTILFAVIGIFSDLIQETPSTLNSANPVIVILCVCATIVNILRPTISRTREMKVLFIGLVILFLFVINTNLVNLNLLPWQWRNEELGFVFLLVGLGFVAAHRFIDNEKKLFVVEQEMATAHEIQSRILPRIMPSIEGLDIVARYIPMSAVAGDFYDFLVKDNRLCILIADVSGHGVGAALIGSMLKIAFASQTQHMSNPALVLEGINRIFHSRIEGNFVTAFCISIDSEKGLIQYANAGHPPSLLFRKTEEDIYDLAVDGIILGPFPDATYKNKSLAFKTDDRILLYTDGITEVTNHSDEFFGDHRLKDFVRANANLPASQFVNELFEHLYTWSGKASDKTLDDDLTVIVVDIGLKPSNREYGMT
jgi:sigma-B regulation protein RsbU (phosphoserine phosphatase)